MKAILALLLCASPLFADTFGNTNNHSTAANMTTGQAVCGRVTSPAGTGTITSITAYLGSASGVHLGAAIYSDGAGPNPVTRLAIQSVATTSDGIAGHETIALSYVFAANTVYWLCVMPDATIEYFFDAAADNQNDIEAMTYPTWNDPYGTPDFSVNRTMEIFATYTPTAGGVGGLMMMGVGK